MAHENHILKSGSLQKRSLKNDLNLYQRLHVCVTTSAWSAGEVPHGNAHTWVCSPAAFMPSHRHFWDKGIGLLDGNCLSKADTQALARVRTQCIPSKPTAGCRGVISPQEPSNHLLGKILPKSMLAGAFTCCSTACRGPRDKWLWGSLATPVPGHGSLCSFLCCAEGSRNECFPLLPRTPASRTLFVWEHSAWGPAPHSLLTSLFMTYIIPQKATRICFSFPRILQFNLMITLQELRRILFI